MRVRPLLGTKKTCCEANVHRHVWAVGPNREKQKVSPPEYISLLMDWVRNGVLRDDAQLSLSDTKRVMNRLVRVYVHYYTCHGDKFAEYGIDAHMNYCFKHFMYFAKEYAGLQIRGSTFQSLNSNSRELELTNLLGLVLGCIEAKFCK